MEKATDNLNEKPAVTKNFIELAIDKDLAEGKYTEICTRFPPEPNGYLHIGHAKSILLNYGLAKKYNGKFHLRFDDTNPTKEKTEFVQSIIADVEWLGAAYDGEVRFASNYFDQMYEAAVKLIKKGKAYVCDLTADQIREYRGTLKEPGKNSPYRDRSIEENLQLFEDMKNGKYPDGSKVLRAKIDMSSPNINMRDPILYRVARMTHHNTGDKWCIYPMYDFAHPIEDAIERNPDGLDLIKENSLRLQADNLTIVGGTAPESLDALPAATHAFIGGSAGHLKEILQLLYSRNPEIRVVITAITLETIGQIMALQKEMALPEPEIIQIQVSSAKKAGPYHLMQGQNPVYIVSF